MLFSRYVFLGGLVRNGRSWPNLRHIFLLIWLVVMLLPTVLSGDAPHFGRMVGAVPAIAIMMSLGLAWLGEKLSNITNLPSTSKKIFTVYRLLFTINWQLIFYGTRLL